jgi:putative salt-induced outer membrane protein YdiY
MYKRLLFSLALLSITTPGIADEVVLNNGDRLTGKVTGASAGKLRLWTEATGEISIDLSKVKSFNTDAPVEVRLKDGTTLKQKLEPVPENPGEVRTSGGEFEPLTIKFTQIDLINPPPPKWTGSVLASGTISRGNTYAESFALSADAVRRSPDDRMTLGAGYSYGRERDPDTGNKSTSEDNWFVLGKYDYFLSKKLYVFGLTRVERDRIARLDLRVSPSTGLGYQWVERSDFNANTEAGIGWVYEDYEDAGSDSHFTARLAYHIEKRFNDRLTVFHNLEYLPSVEDGSDYNVNADVGTRITLTKPMFTEFKVEWQFDSTPAPGAEKNDLKYLLSLGWKF